MPKKKNVKRDRVRLTVEQKQEAREAFDLYDVDGSGVCVCVGVKE